MPGDLRGFLTSLGNKVVTILFYLFSKIVIRLFHRVDCLYYVQQRQADLVPVDPEDMYVAAKIPNQDFVVFQEYRTDEEPDGTLTIFLIRQDKFNFFKGYLNSEIPLHAGHSLRYLRSQDQGRRRYLDTRKTKKKQ